MKWLRNAGIVIGAALLAIGLSMLGRSGRQQKKALARESDYLASQQRGSTQKAKKYAAEAETHKADAKKAAEAHIKVMEGIEDAEISELISSWTRS